MKKLLSAILCVTLCMGLAAPMASAADVKVPASPQLEVVVNTVLDDKKPTGYVEVSVQVDSAAAAVWQSNVILSYNSEKLTPVTWGMNEKTIAISANQWSTAHTLGYGGTMGKPALLQQSKTAADTSAYLYIAAEAMRAGGATESLPAGAEKTKLVTVRFSLVGGAAAAMDTTDTSITAMEALGQFQVITAPDYTNNLVGATSFVRAGAIMGERERPTYYEVDATDEGVEVMLPPAIVYVREASVDGGSTVAPGGQNAITFFDWDGKVVDAVATGSTLDPAVLETVEGKLSHKPAYAFDRWLIVVAITQKTGPVLVTSYGTKTANNEPLTKDNAAAFDADIKDFADFTNITGTIYVMAAYSAKAGVNGTFNNAPAVGEVGSDGTAGDKDATMTDSVTYYQLGDQTCYQYNNASANTGSYGIRVKVERKNDAGVGVTRAGAPSLVVMMYPAADDQKPVTTVLALGNTDVTEVEFVASKTISRVEYWFIDNMGTSWVQSGRRSELENVLNRDFVQEGALRYLIGWAIAEAGANKWPDADESLLRYLNDAGYAKISSTNIAAAKTALSGAVVDGVLAYADAQAALASYK